MSTFYRPIASCLTKSSMIMGGGGSAHPCTVLGWSEYLWISGYSDGGVGGGVPIHVIVRASCVRKVGWCGLYIHPGAILGRSEYFGSYAQVWYNPYSILRISMPFDGITGHPSSCLLVTEVQQPETFHFSILVDALFRSCHLDVHFYPAWSQKHLVKTLTESFKLISENLPSKPFQTGEKGQNRSHCFSAPLDFYHSVWDVFVSWCRGYFQMFCTLFQLQFNLSMGIIGAAYLASTIAYAVGTVIVGPITDKLVWSSNLA